MKSDGSPLAGLIAASLASVLLGCATPPPPGPSPIQRKLQAMADRWNHEPIPVGLKRQVFYDDALIAFKSTNIVRRMGKARKLNNGQPLIVQDKAYEDALGQYGIGMYLSVLREPGQPFKIWYHFGGGDGRLGYAESTDGLHWDKSAAGLLRFNNFVHYPVHGPCVIYDRNDDWMHRYKLVSGGGFESWRKGLTFAYSRDGKNWNVYQTLRHLEECDSDTGHSLMYDEELGAYRISTRYWHMGLRAYRQFARSYLDRGSMPVLLNALFIPAPKDEPWELIDERIYSNHIYGVATQKRDDIYIGYINLFDHVGQGFYLATSRNGVNWDFTWVDQQQALIDHGPPGSFDDTGIYHAASPLIDVGDEHWIYYSGYSGHHDALYVPGSTNKPSLTAVGAAAIRRDGLFWVESAGGEALIETKTFLLQGASLIVNADARSGVVRIELLDAQGQQLPRWANEQAALLTGDGCDQRVMWPAGSLAELKDKPVRLRFSLAEGAKLYGFQVVP